MVQRRLLPQLIIAMLAVAIALAFGALAHAAPERSMDPIDTGWLFIKGDPAGAEAERFDDSRWLKTTLPHTFNAGDGEHGGSVYRGPGWYRRPLDLAALAPGRRLFIQFDGAALRAEVFINGRSVGRHEGGYARFRFDITDAVHPGRNLLAVRVDSSPTDQVAPLGGDFTIFGGLYRPVSLFETAALHLDALDYGGPGVYVRAEKVTPKAATIVVVSRVRNDGPARRARVAAEIVDAGGQSVGKAVRELRIGAGASLPVTQTISIARPHLWNGRADPYLYRVVTTVAPAAGGPRDRVSVPLGVRTFRVDAQEGFVLNGRRMPARGVDLFQSERPGRGTAVSDADVDQDFQILEQMGVTGLRLVHFQHPQRAYDDADRDGLVLWTEIPLNSRVDASPAFEANIVQQLRELIRQNYDHPSVFFWGLGNEIYKSDAASNRILDRLQLVAHEEDPTRLTTYAHCCAPENAPHARHTDVIAFNKYFGWYPEQADDFGSWADRSHALLGDRPMAVSEYGAGGGIEDQQDPPQRPVTTGAWHPEQYQALFHEKAGAALMSRRYLWAQFVWVGFDVASAGRNEGAHAGLNDKGLVTYDRRTRKDAYYWYQAAWSSEPMVHINSRRLNPRETSPIEVRVYSNAAVVRLRLNGADLGEHPTRNHVAEWPRVALSPGDNRVEASTSAGASDAVTWRYRARGLSDPPILQPRP